MAKINVEDLKLEKNWEEAVNPVHGRGAFIEVLVDKTMSIDSFLKLNNEEMLNGDPYLWIARGSSKDDMHLNVPEGAIHVAMHLTESALQNLNENVKSITEVQAIILDQNPPVLVYRR